MSKDWDGNILNAKESDKGEKISYNTNTGIYTYDTSGTYGQEDYTVRERKDGTSDVYVKSDSDKYHSHDHIDKDGNLLESYHDYLLSLLSDDEINFEIFETNEQCVDEISHLLKNKPKTLRKRP